MSFTYLMGFRDHRPFKTEILNIFYSEEVICSTPKRFTDIWYCATDIAKKYLLTGLKYPYEGFDVDMRNIQNIQNNSCV